MTVDNHCGHENVCGVLMVDQSDDGKSPCTIAPDCKFDTRKLQTEYKNEIKDLLKKLQDRQTKAFKAECFACEMNDSGGELFNRGIKLAYNDAVGEIEHLSIMDVED